ncbi:TrbC/VirB2 family protein [Paraburkholderia terricola]|uniref:Type IV secretion system protein VirB2 n=1 Tax=Paraburkholderia terricola TaxID=169427 RepID=A0A1M6J1T9_9BURK|nr:MULTISPECIES: TrbC/VirB2 family protein [Paraburkholderia]SDN48811.1 type IV secretion system protein VirB2 [Paraburkholderia sediminicola]SHJ40622.1 type IV secretion system protein VirB2 [Paraburkholderia terricola]
MKLRARIKAWIGHGSTRRTSLDRQVARTVSLTIAMLFGASPAWAQLSQVNTLLSTIQTTLLGVGGVICSISIIWAGFRMMFQHARFGDIANVFIGGLFVGCATVIAGMLIPTGG